LFHAFRISCFGHSAENGPQLRNTQPASSCISIGFQGVGLPCAIEVTENITIRPPVFGHGIWLVHYIKSLKSRLGEPVVEVNRQDPGTRHYLCLTPATFTSCARLQTNAKRPQFLNYLGMLHLSLVFLVSMHAFRPHIGSRLSQSTDFYRRGILINGSNELLESCPISDIVSPSVTKLRFLCNSISPLSDTTLSFDSVCTRSHRRPLFDIEAPWDLELVT
jgi:hypothetical protein